MDGAAKEESKVGDAVDSARLGKLVRARALKAAAVEFFWRGVQEAMKVKESMEPRRHDAMEGNVRTSE